MFNNIKIYFYIYTKSTWSYQKTDLEFFEEISDESFNYFVFHQTRRARKLYMKLRRLTEI